MASDSFVKYRSYDDKMVATSIFQILSERGLNVKWEDSEGHFDPSFANNEILNLYYIKLQQQDFKQADEILEKAISESDPPPADYYLFFPTKN